MELHAVVSIGSPTDSPKSSVKSASSRHPENGNRLAGKAHYQPTGCVDTLGKRMVRLLFCEPNDILSHGRGLTCPRQIRAIYLHQSQLQKVIQIRFATRSRTLFSTR